MLLLVSLSCSFFVFRSIPLCTCASPGHVFGSHPTSSSQRRSTCSVMFVFCSYAFGAMLPLSFLSRPWTTPRLACCFAFSSLPLPVFVFACPCLFRLIASPSLFALQFCFLCSFFSSPSRSSALFFLALSRSFSRFSLPALNQSTHTSPCARWCADHYNACLLLFSLPDLFFPSLVLNLASNFPALSFFPFNRKMLLLLVDSVPGQRYSVCSQRRQSVPVLPIKVPP